MRSEDTGGRRGLVFERRPMVTDGDLVVEWSGKASGAAAVTRERGHSRARVLDERKVAFAFDENAAIMHLEN